MRVDDHGPAVGSDVAAYYGLPGLVDLRGVLPWRDDRGPVQALDVREKRGLVVHYAGAAQDLERSDRDLILGYAGYHVVRNWGDGGTLVMANGIQYHLGIGRDGTVYLLRSLELEAWHSGNAIWNRGALAVIVPIGEGQRARPEALAALRRVADWWIALTGSGRETVVGHSELSATGCPGSLMADFVLPYRTKGGPVVPEWYVDEVTGCVVGHGFYAFWQAHGGIRVFGRPLTNEFDVWDEAAGKWRTVQVFERYVMEYHPEAPEEWRVMGRHIGREVLPALLSIARGQLER